MNIVLDAWDIEEYSDVFVACCEEILAVLREQDLKIIKHQYRHYSHLFLVFNDLDNRLRVRLVNTLHQLAGQHAVQVDPLVLAEGHQLALG